MNAPKAWSYKGTMEKASPTRMICKHAHVLLPTAITHEKQFSLLMHRSAQLRIYRKQRARRTPQVHFEAPGVELLAAVGARHLAGLHVPPELVLGDAVRCQHDVRVRQHRWIRRAFGPVIPHHLHTLAITSEPCCHQHYTRARQQRWT